MFTGNWCDNGWHDDIVKILIKAKKRDIFTLRVCTHCVWNNSLSNWMKGWPPWTIGWGRCTHGKYSWGTYWPIAPICSPSRSYLLVLIFSMHILIPFWIMYMIPTSPMLCGSTLYCLHPCCQFCPIWGKQKGLPQGLGSMVGKIWCYKYLLHCHPAMAIVSKPNMAVVTKPIMVIS